MTNALSVLTSTTGNKTDRWNTPIQFVADVLTFFNHDITTDPCCNDKDNPNIPATVCYDETDDGLTKPWKGKVFMNHPYSDSKNWIPYGVLQYESGVTSEMVMLIKLDVSTKWWRSVSSYPWIGINKRLKFGDGRGAAPFQSAIIYLGNDIDRFISVFGKYGPCYHTCDSD